MYHIWASVHAARRGDRYGHLCGYCDPCPGDCVVMSRVEAHANQKSEMQLLQSEVTPGISSSELQPTLRLVFTCQ